MSESTALRLANALEAWTLGKPTYHRKAAVELRRLHALNGELLEALKELEGAARCVQAGEWDRDSIDVERRKARAAIAKAEGQP
jgi:hypothetical protein